MPKKPSGSQFSQRGVTIFELLVVVVIIVILSSIAVFSYFGTVSSAKDAKRKTDLQFLYKLLTIYYLDHGFFPTAGTAGISPLNCQIAAFPSANCQDLLSELRKYSPKIPFDPNDPTLTGGQCSTTNCYNYITPNPAHSVSCICAKLDNLSGSSKSTLCGDIPDYNYCLQVSF